MESRAHVTISGNVQGVGFRFFTLKQAQRLNLVGTVKNMPNGSVDIVVEGDKSTIQTFTNHVRQGPRLAEVNSVDIEWQEPQNEFSKFRIID